MIIHILAAFMRAGYAVTWVPGGNAVEGHCLFGSCILINKHLGAGVGYRIRCSQQEWDTEEMLCRSLEVAARALGVLIA